MLAVDMSLLMNKRLSIISILSHFIINTLYGADYIEAKGPLLFMIWSTVFASLSYVRAIWMISEAGCKSVSEYIRLRCIDGIGTMLENNTKE